MNKKIQNQFDTNVLEQLDFMRIRSDIAEYCITHEGKNALLCRMPLIDEHEIIKNQQYARDCMNLIAKNETVFFLGYPHLTAIFPTLKIAGGVLDIEHFFSLLSFCKTVATCKLFFSLEEHTENYPFLHSLIERIPLSNESEKIILSIIDNSGKLRDLPRLKVIRSKITKLERERDTRLHAYLKNSSLQTALESTIPVFRANRQVLAVKSNFKGKIRGIVHELSQTGQTVYIEPDDVVEKNNELIEAEFELQREIRLILAQTSEMLRPYANDFIISLDILTIIDCSFAIARWGLQQTATFAKICDDEKPLNLVQARHPLLGSKAVPIDIVFYACHRVLIITGPNTGGKTVGIKTLALFALLNQAGFPIPAHEETRLPIFYHFFADIGDLQSLDNSLSTFSGHIKNISSILQKADSKSLVLLDELGSGTEPQEGGALAMAILDNLIQKKAFVLVTTHQGVLKNYAYTHEACINASVEFDSDGLKPSYRILMGVPGESHALEIAKKSGLDENIIVHAKDYLQNKQADVAELIKNLNKKNEELLNRERILQQKEQKTEEKIRKVDLKMLRLKQDDIELLKKQQVIESKFLEKNRKMLENLVCELREGEITREKTMQVKATIKQLEDEIAQKNATLLQKQEDLQNLQNSIAISEKKIVDFVEGDTVFIGKAKIRGTILAKAKKGIYLVQTGSIKMNVSENNLCIAPQIQNSAPSIIIEKDTSVSQKNALDMPVLELRLLGLRLETAIKYLQDQLDKAHMHGLAQFSVIHGKGDGILQEGVHTYLKKCPFVSDFAFAPADDGGTGKTYVNLSI